MGTYAASYYKPPAEEKDPYANSLARWGQEGRRTDEDVNAARRGRDTAAGAAGAAVGSFGSRNPSANVGGWAPSAVAGYSPTQIQQWMGSMSGLGAAPTLSKPPAVSAQSVNYKDVNFDNPNLSQFSADRLLNFDPSAAGETFAKGAFGDFQNSLKDNLQEYDDQSIAAGRLRTGQYDVDKGRVVTRLGSDFSNRIAQAALEFSGQRLQGLTSGTQMQLERASNMDANARAIAELNANLGLRAQETNAGNALTASTANAANALAGDRNAIDLFGAQTSRAGTMGNLALGADELNFKKASAIDAGTWGQATFMDNAGNEQARTGLEAALGRERTYLDNYNTASDRSSSYASADRQWADYERQMKELKDEIARLRGEGPAKTGGGTGSELTYGNDNLRNLAKTWGVPYRP